LGSPGSGKAARRTTKDEYAWLEDTDDPRVVAWARKEDRAARASVKRYSGTLFKRLVPFYRRPIMRSVGLTKAGVVLFLSDDRSYKVELLRPDGERELIADSAKLGKDVVIQAVQAREDGSAVAVHHSEGGSDEGTVTIMEPETRETIDTLKGFIGSIAWMKDGTYYYSRTYRKGKAPDGVAPPTDRVIRREGEKEELVFGKGLPTNTFVGVGASRDGSRALLDAYYGFERSRPYGGRLERPESWVPLYRDTDASVTNVDYADGRHLLLSFERNLGEVLSVSGRNVRRVIPESTWPLLEAVLAGDELLCHYLVDACSELVTYGKDGRLRKRIKFDVPGSITGEPAISAHGSDAVVSFSSFALPFRVYMVRDGKLRTLLSEGLPGRYTVGEGHARSRDGTRIHYFFTAKKGASPKKVLLFGYGGFRISLTPTYNPAYGPLLADGGALAYANLRGGLEHGEDWHKAGKRERKFNVFDDYLAVLAKLRREGRMVVGFGRSNGGLLMGATMNARPDLFNGVLIGYPVLDMMAFHRLLIGRAWVPEYGDPDDPKDAEFLLKYSPYHNIRRGGRYPPVFMYTGLKDDRVHPAHAFKFCSRLRDAGAKVSLRVEAESGHIGTTPETRMREEADKLAFVYETLGMRP
jgi:prolyl oligopeptidase